MTVWGDTFSTSAVSSTLRPPKNRSSITLARRGSPAARSLNASSSAQISRARSVPAAGIRSKSSPVAAWSARRQSPPRLAVARARRVDQDPAHDPGAHRQEVRPVLPVHCTGVDEPHECLVDERRGIAANVRSLVPDILTAKLPESTSPVPSASRGDTSRRAFVTLGAATLASAVTGSTVWLLTRPGDARPEERTIGRTPDARIQIDQVSRDFAVPADGSGVVYKGVGWNSGRPVLGGGRLFLHRWERAEPDPLVEDGSPRAPFTSPDGRFVGFIDSGRPDLRTVPVSGGSAMPLCVLDGQSRGASWGDDDHIVFATANPETGLQRIPARNREHPRS